MPYRRLFLLALLLVALATPASAGTISLAWDPVSHPELTGYHVYYGTTPGNLDQTVTVGEVTEVTLSGLTDCTDYHVAVRAVAIASGPSAPMGPQRLRRSG